MISSAWLGVVGGLGVESVYAFAAYVMMGQSLRWVQVVVRECVLLNDSVSPPRMHPFRVDNSLAGEVEAEVLSVGEGHHPVGARNDRTCVSAGVTLAKLNASAIMKADRELLGPHWCSDGSELARDSGDRHGFYCLDDIRVRGEMA